MNYLLDTHILIWHLTDDARLSEDKSSIIENSGIKKYISIASIWEIGIKKSIGKIKLEGIEILDINISHIKELVDLPFHHRDPFDRMIIAQAIIENLTVIS